MLFAICGLNKSIAQTNGLYGEWSGTVYQNGPHNFKSSYDAKIVLKGNTGQMNYASLSCGGTIVFERKSENKYFYRETITYGKSKCMDGGLIEVSLHGNSLDWTWTGGGATVKGTLSPVHH